MNTMSEGFFPLFVADILTKISWTSVESHAQTRQVVHVCSGFLSHETKWYLIFQ